MTDEAQTVFVEAPARLHFGLLDLRGPLGRKFGGIGTAAPAPALLVSARKAASLEVGGDDADRAAGFARRFLAGHDIHEAGGIGGATLCVHRSIPSHVGLGSGTQLALAVGRALAELYGVATDAPGLAQAVGRAKRSAIGTWTFDGGGLVLEGGRRPAGECVAPLLARLPFPPAWRCVVAVPDSAPGINGSAEEAAFAQLPTPPEHDAERVAHLVLMALLPALADADLATFGATLSTPDSTATAKARRMVSKSRLIEAVAAPSCCRCCAYASRRVVVTASARSREKVALIRLSRDRS